MAESTDSGRDVATSIVDARMEGSDPIAEQLRMRRHQLRLTQGDVAASMGTRHGHVSQLESGRRGPTLPVLRRWTAALGMELTLREVES